MNKQIINEKSLPFPPFSPSPTRVKSALNLGEGFAPHAKVCQKCWHKISTREKSQPNLGQGFTTRAKVCQKCWHIIPTWEKSQPNLGQGFATRAKACQNFWQGFTPPGYGLPEISGSLFQLPSVITAIRQILVDGKYPSNVLTDGSYDRWQMAISFSQVLHTVTDPIMFHLFFQ